MASADEAKLALIRRFHKDRPLAHRVLFKHRHKNRMTDAHNDFIVRWHSPVPRLNLMAFRGFAKSTLAEEAILLGACFREFKNYLIIGSNFDRAAERLFAIRHEIKTNEHLQELFGNLVGDVDADGDVILSNGVRIQALGRNQALRGVKHLDQRPDGFFADDLEARSDARSEEGRSAIHKWFMAELIPACDPEYKGRVCSTPLDAEALPMKLMKAADWETSVYPIVYPDEQGEIVALWPDRFPLDVVVKMRESFIAQGLLREFNMEYMCEATAQADKQFKSDGFRIEPVTRTWQACYAMFDPARTAKTATSATTGFACWSWINNRLIVWDAWGRFLLPDEIVTAVFDCFDEHHPTIIGVEEDGLNEFLMQPLRREQVNRGGEVVPFRAMRAPKGKNDFIRGLQPFFNAKEVIFAKPLPDLQQQLLSFPTGRIDVPNALAYALKMRPGAPFYDAFGMRHVASDLRMSKSAPSWLCVNASQGLTTGVLVQCVDGCFNVFADWVREGDAADRLPAIMKEAQIEAGKKPRLIASPAHFDRFANKGLVQAARRIPVEIGRGASEAVGRAELRRVMDREIRGVPAFQVDSEARWVLNGLAGGYARAADKNGMIKEDAEEGQYKVLMEGLETFAALLSTGVTGGDEDDRTYATTPSGARYLTARR